jgi:hypothetical protein
VRSCRSRGFGCYLNEWGGTNFEVAELNLIMGGCPEVEPHSRPEGGRVVKLEVDLRTGHTRSIYCESIGCQAANRQIVDG